MKPASSRNRHAGPTQQAGHWIAAMFIAGSMQAAANAAPVASAMAETKTAQASGSTAVSAKPVKATLPKKLAMLDFELIDITGETAKDEAQKIRLQQISRQLRAAFIDNNLYQVVDNAPATAMIADMSSRFALHDCNGCDVDIGKALKVDRVMTAWVQKVSNLILNINIQIRNVDTGLVMLNKSVDIRGNTDDSWHRGVRYMVRSMVEKNQANR